MKNGHKTLWKVHIDWQWACKNCNQQFWPLGNKSKNHNDLFFSSKVAFVKKAENRAGKVAELLTSLDAIAAHSDFIPSTQIMVYNHSYLQFQGN